MLFLLLLLFFSSPVFCHKGKLLSYRDCTTNALCLIQKSCIELDSTEFHSLVLWNEKIAGNLSDCTGIRFSLVPDRDNDKETIRVQIQIRAEEPIGPGFGAHFALDFVELEKTSNERKLHPNELFYAYFHGDEYEPAFSVSVRKTFLTNDENSADFANTMVVIVQNVIMFDFNWDWKDAKENAGLKNARMRLITAKEIFTYQEMDLWDLVDEMASKKIGKPLLAQYIWYCLLILLVYSITFYFLDLHCRRLQFTTLDREEMEEYFFPPARYRNKLEHFRMMRGLTKIEKEKITGKCFILIFLTNFASSGAVPEGILVDFEN